ncbi:PREDICTED: uncharacterized protein LOC109187401 [Ipomoea nil]|uniref:uncharacterized protein LOC109187401 n=1 Tax=Ipomoea nil TaxID=35883 RepID=UPI000900BC0F|nr:PREDICTED: uncharacterized protein LOC109187401 [Ipomoea nil]
MSSPTGSQIPDPEIPTQDETSNSHQCSQTETLEEEESQNLDNPQDQEVADQEDPKSHPEENPDDEFLGEALPLPPAIHVAFPPMGGDMLDAPLPSPANHNRRAPKRKKSKIYAKKQQAIDKKLSTLLGSLNPIPFVPSKVLDFSKHEKLMKQLGLWEFVHIEFDQNIRVDLIAQLVASYDPKLRCSYVNERRIQVNRADLGRALKLHVKKEKGGGNVLEGVDLDGESLPDESVAFIEDFVSNWVLLHEDAWIMPSEVLNWTKFIKDKHPEKVDWAGLFWFMVEKELIRGEKLEDCYYAAHLQCLIKSQREVLFSEEPDKVQHEEGFLAEETEKVQHESRLFTEEPANVEVKEVEDGGGESDVKVGGLAEGQEEGTLIKELNVELTLGQESRDVQEMEMGPDVQEVEDVKDVEMMNFEEHVEEEQEEEGEERGPFLQKCMREGISLDENEQTEEENEELEEEDEEQEGEEDGLALPPLVDTLGVGGDGHAENYLEAMETTQIALDSHGHFPCQSSVDLLASRTDLNSGGTFFDHGGKRGVEHDEGIGSHSLGGNKRLRMDGPWDNKPLGDFGTCIEQMQQLMTRARMMYEAKEQNEQECSLYNQYLLAELQKRDDMVQHLDKARREETQKRDQQIYRLERELFMMGNILEGYRKALKNTHMAFAEYRLQAQLPEEPVYKDSGPGGLVLSTTEIEKLRCKQEEEYRSNCLMLELKAREVEEGYVTEFEMHMNKVLALDNRLTILSDNLKELKEMHDKRKAPETQQISMETPND